MEEIQFSSAYKGKYGIFRKLYSFIVNHLPFDLEYIEAYTNKNNEKAIAILEKLGLKIIGSNKNGRSYHFYVEYKDFLSWLSKSN